MEKKFNVAIYLNALAVCLGLACTIINMVRGIEFNLLILAMSIVEICIYLLICFYAFVGYKKPHGNLLRYLMFVFSFTLIFRVYTSTEFLLTKNIIFYCYSIILISYMSGRLNKIEKNKYIAVVILLLLCHCSHSGVVVMINAKKATADFVSRICIYNNAFMWLALSSAYFTRFLQHKEAGLMDAPKN